MTDWSAPSWSNTVRRLRDDVNVLAWLLAEQLEVNRRYVELAGKRFSVDECCTYKMGVGVTDQSPIDDAERAAPGALEPSSSS